MYVLIVRKIKKYILKNILIKLKKIVLFTYFDMCELSFNWTCSNAIYNAIRICNAIFLNFLFALCFIKYQ